MTKPKPTGEQHAIVALADMHASQVDAIESLRAENLRLVELYRADREKHMAAAMVWSDRARVAWKKQTEAALKRAKEGT